MNTIPHSRTFQGWAWLLSLIASIPCVAAEPDPSRLPPAASDPVDFVRDIQPILEVSCLRCHGPERPKGGLRLDNQESAFKGGGNGPVLVAGESARSRLIHVVARLDPDSAMPPDGKGEPLTAAQVGLLRAWIDQGAAYPPDRQLARQLFAFSVTPVARWVSVEGDVRRFREDRWMRDEGEAGIEHLRWRQPVGSDGLLTVEGRALPGAGDYSMSLDYAVRGKGWVRAGFERARRYYDDSGGYAPDLPRPGFQLGRDLHMDFGKAWAEVAIKAPDYPEVVLGYEYRFRDGDKSTLQWGKVTDPVTGTERRIYPASKHVDEAQHIVKVDVRHEIAGVRFEDNFRGTFYRLATRHDTVVAFDLGQAGPEKVTRVEEEQSHFEGANSLRLERQVNSWLALSAGHLYSQTDGEAGYRQTSALTPDAQPGLTLNPFGPFVDRFWFSNQILLERSAHVFNANALIGPVHDWTVTAGVQSEWFRQRGVGDVRLDEGDPDPAAGGLLIQPAFMDANHDRVQVEEHVGVRWTGVPWTVVYAEARLRQESAGQFEREEVSGAQDFMRRTDATVDLNEWRTGMSVSPRANWSLHGQYVRRERNSSYDHSLDEAGAGVVGEGYSGFIRERDTVSDEVGVRLVWRATSWVRTTLKYEYRTTDWTTVTDPTTAFVPPIGATSTAEARSHQYSVNMTLTPWSRLLMGATLSLADTRLETGPYEVNAVVPWRGKIYTGLANFSYLLDEETDWHGWYSWNRADYSSSNGGLGLPLGAEYTRHGLQTGLGRRLGRHARGTIDYGWYRLEEPSTGGLNDYEAHAVFVSLSFRWP